MRIALILLLIFLSPLVVEATDWSNDANCIGAYTFDESSGDLLDVCVNSSNNGSLNGATQGATGQFGDAYDFDGTNDWVDFGDVTTFDGIGSFTATAWIDVDSFMGNDTSVMRKDGTLTPMQINTQSGGRIRMPTWNGGLSLQQVSHAWATGAYHHYAGRWDKDTSSGCYELFVDGSSIGTSATCQTGVITSGGSNVLRFGATESGAEDFNGRLDEVLFMESYMTPTEINDVMDNGIVQAGAAARRTYMIN